MRTALALVGFVCLFLAPNGLVDSVSARQSAKAPEVTEGRLEAVDREGAPRGTCPLKHTDVKADVSGFVARVTVTQQFENPFDGPIEAVYLFPLSNGAAVDGMTMRVGDRVIRAEIKKREEARATYEAARAAGKVASLLEQQRPNVFTQSVANILPGARVEVVITYVETLSYEDGAYRFVFPMVVGGRYMPASKGGAEAAKVVAPVATGRRAGHDVSLEVSVDAGLPIEEMVSTLHEIEIERPSPNGAVVRLAKRDEIPNRDFVFTYKVAGGKIEDALLTHHDKRGGFFTFILQPPDRVAAESVAPKELVFVVDTSGSMSGFPIEKAKECIGLALDGLYPDDTFNLITFAGDTHVLFPEPVRATPENLKAAREFLESRDGAGGTEMMKAIRAALEPTDDQNHVRIVCFMTDGYVGDDMEIIGEIQKHPNARVFSFGIGNAVNRYLLDGMAEEGRGEVEYVTLDDDGSAAARRFWRRVRDPLLVDVSIDWGGLQVTDVYPKRIPDLFGAKPVVVCGRYEGGQTGVIHLRGTADGREVVRDVEVTLPDDEPRHDVLATLWARRKVDDLMRSDYIGIATGAEKADVRDAITDLGLGFRLATQYTSFVAVEEAAVTAGGDPSRIPIEGETPDGVGVGAGGGGGSTSETVTVTAGESLVVSSDSVLIASHSITSLPLNGRNLLELVQVTSGVAQVAVCSTSSVAPQGVAVRLDGSDADDPAATGVPTEAVQEYTIRTSGFTADNGAASGNVVDIRTKSGTNDFHGSAYEFNRTSAVASQPFAEKAVAGPTPIREGVFARNQFGFTFGGPAVRDTLFLFGAADWLRVRSTRNAPFLVPTPELLAASSPATRAFFDDFALRPGVDARTVRVGDVPFAGTGPFAALGADFPAFTQLYVPVCGDTGAGTAQNTTQSMIRADWRITDLTMLMVRYGLDRATLFPGAVSVSPYAGLDTGARIANDAVEASVEIAINPQTISTTKFVFDRRAELRPLGERPAGPSLYALPRPFVPLGDGTAPIALPGYLPLTPGEGLPSDGPRTGLRFAEEFGYVVNSHLFKFGGGWSRISDDRDSGAFREPVVSLGRAVPDALDNLVLGRAFRTDAVDPLARFERAARYDETALYVTDMWRISPNLTLDLGVRYELFGVARDTDPSRDLNFYEGEGATPFARIAAGAVLPAAAGPVGGLYASDRDNWSPRFGFAWDFLNNGQNQLRGSYGTRYGRVADRAAAVSYQNPPSFGVAEIFAARLGDVVGATGAPARVRAVDSRLRSPKVHFWNLSFAREVGDAVVTVDYVGSKGVGLASVDDVNRPFSGAVYLGLAPTSANPLARLNGQYGDIWQLRNSGSSSYNGASLGVESRRLDPFGLWLSARYTWSHAIDNVSSETPVYGFSPGLLDPFDPRLDRGDSDLDVRHRFWTRGVWEMPFAGQAQDGWRFRMLGGWTMTWIFDARTGTPFTVYDCTNALSGCSRLLQTTALDRDGSAAVSTRPADAATGNRYVFVDLAAQLAGRGAYANPLSGTSDFGPFPSNMTARNAFRGPGMWNLDGAVAKTISFNERLSLQLRVETFNLFNHANLFVSRGEADVSASTYVPAFYDGRRQVQFGARLAF